MALKERYGVLMPVILLFVIANSLPLLLHKLWPSLNVDKDVLIIGNLVLFLITMVSFFLAKKGLYNANPHAFSRSVMGSIMVKMFLCAALAFVYISLNKAALNKPALFICMGLYLVYTFLEVSALTRLLRAKPNA